MRSIILRATHTESVLMDRTKERNLTASSTVAVASVGAADAAG